MGELNLDTVVKILRDEHDIKSYVEQTGGGTATIYAGELRDVENESIRWNSGARVVTGTVIEQRWQACAGPGWFTGPGWTNGRADTSDFYVGPDDDGEADPIVADDTWDEKRAADVIAEQVKASA